MSASAYRKLANGLVHRDSTHCKLRRHGFFSRTVARNVLPIHDALKEFMLDPSFERITRPLFPFKNRIDILRKVKIL
jgi:hypothetical protein